jgi:hypothetical protein
MKVSKKLLLMVVMFLLGVSFVACIDDITTTAETTTTEETTTVEETTTEEFDFTTLVAALKTEYADTLDNEEFVATDDLTLVSTIQEVSVSWSSNNTDLLSDAGVVTRPSYNEGNQTVVLTATLTVGEQTEDVQFFVTIQKLDKSDAERAGEVFTIVTAFPTKEKWTSVDELEFLSSGQDLDGVEYNVTWSSSHPEIIATDGSITQPETEDVDVTITATININSVDYTKDVVFTVAKIEEGQPVNTIAEAIALGEGAYVNVLGVTVNAIMKDGTFFFTDGVDIMYVYSTSTDVEVGQVYDITGEFVYYYLAPEFVSSQGHPIKAVASTDDAVEAPFTTGTVMDVISGLTTPTEENPFDYEVYEITAKIFYEESWGNYSLFLVPTDYDFTVPLADGQTQPTGDSIMVYYRSNLDVLKGLHGEEVTLKVQTHGWRTDLEVWYANFFGSYGDVVVNFATDTDAVTAALNTVDFPTEITEDMTLDLLPNIFGVDLTYASTDDLVINATTGVVDFASQTTQVTVDLTVTATKGTVTDTKVFTIKVGELPTITVADALATSNDVLLKTQGVVYYLSQEGYYIQDATGKVFVYTGGAPTVALGDEIVIVGLRGEYKGSAQLKNTTIESTVSTGNDYTQTVLEAFDPATTTLEAGYLYTVQARVELEGSFNNIFFYDGETKIGGLRYKSLADSVTALEAYDGVVIIVDLLYYNLDGVPMFYFNGGDSDITVYVMSDAEKIAEDKAALDFGGDLYEATDVVLPATGTNGSAIAWAITADAGSNATLTDGTLSLLAVTEEATVEITATLTLGDLTETAVFTYTLKNLTLVNLADFSSQTLGATVTVRGIVYAVTQNGFFIDDTTGLLFVYTGGAPVYVAGDEVELTGAVGQYANEFQLTGVAEYPAAITTGNVYEQTPVVFEDGVTTLVAGQTYTVIGTVAIEGSFNNAFIYYNDVDNFGIYYKSPSASIDAIKAEVGNLVAVNIIYYNGGNSFVYVGDASGVMPVYTDFTLLHANDLGVWTIPDGTEVYVKGVVTGFGYNCIYLQDENAVGFYLYKPVGYQNDGTVNIGDEVVYLGTLDDYPGTRQLGSGADLVAVLNTGVAVLENVMTLDEIIALTIEDGGKVITTTGLKFVEVASGKLVLEAVGTGETTITLDMYLEDATSWMSDVFQAGDILGETTFMFSKFSGSIVRIELLTLEMTDQNKLDWAVANMPTTIEFTEDLVIGVGEYGATFEVISITGDAATYLDFTTTPGSVLFTVPASDMTGVATIRITQGALPAVDVTVDVVAKAASAYNFVETFTNFSEGGSYLSGTFVGDNSITWTYTLSRGDIALDGTALCFKTAEGRLSATVSGGLSEINIEYKDAFSGAAQFELYVNGVLVATSESVDYDNNGTIATLNLANLTYEGDVAIELVCIGSQTVIDNISWNGYVAP